MLTEMLIGSPSFVLWRTAARPSFASRIRLDVSLRSHAGNFGRRRRRRRPLQTVAAPDDGGAAAGAGERVGARGLARVLDRLPRDVPRVRRLARQLDGVGGAALDADVVRATADAPLRPRLLRPEAGLHRRRLARRPRGAVRRHRQRPRLADVHEHRHRRAVAVRLRARDARRRRGARERLRGAPRARRPRAVALQPLGHGHAARRLRPVRRGDPRGARRRHGLRRLQRRHDDDRARGLLRRVRRGRPPRRRRARGRRRRRGARVGDAGLGLLGADDGRAEPRGAARRSVEVARPAAADARVQPLGQGPRGRPPVRLVQRRRLRGLGERLGRLERPDAARRRGAAPGRDDAPLLRRAEPDLGVRLGAARAGGRRGRLREPLADGDGGPLDAGRPRRGGRDGARRRLGAGPRGRPRLRLLRRRGARRAGRRRRGRRRGRRLRLRLGDRGRSAATSSRRWRR